MAIRTTFQCDVQLWSTSAQLNHWEISNIDSSQNFSTHLVSRSILIRCLELIPRKSSMPNFCDRSCLLRASLFSASLLFFRSDAHSFFNSLLIAESLIINSSELITVHVKVNLMVGVWMTVLYNYKKHSWGWHRQRYTCLIKCHYSFLSPSEVHQVFIISD